MEKHIFVRCDWYNYYGDEIWIEFSNEETLEGDNYPGDSSTSYYRIDTKEELINVLEDVIEGSEELELQVADLIKLLKDSNLGDTFFERFIYNIRWAFEKHNKLMYDLCEQNFLFRVRSEDNKIIMIPFYKEPKEFQKCLLQYCIDEDIKFEKSWFDISEEDIQTWRHEHNVNTLKSTLEKKIKELERSKKRVINLESEIKDLSSKLQDLEK